MNVELKGTVKLIYDEKQINDNLSKKEVILTVDEDTPYPQDISVQALNTKIDLFRDVLVGEKLTIRCNLKGKETNGKYYNQLNVWSIDKG